MKPRTGLFFMYIWVLAGEKNYGKKLENVGYVDWLFGAMPSVKSIFFMVK